MTDNAKRAQRREEQALEAAENQLALRRSIEESQRCVDQSEAMLKRHRQEREDDDSENS